MYLGKNIASDSIQNERYKKEVWNCTTANLQLSEVFDKNFFLDFPSWQRFRVVNKSFTSSQ